ncbi:hypothetical protein OSTOST_20040, partial [Ostertagia ostertagi]
MAQEHLVQLSAYGESLLTSCEKRVCAGPSRRKRSWSCDFVFPRRTCCAELPYVFANVLTEHMKSASSRPASMCMTPRQDPLTFEVLTLIQQNARILTNVELMYSRKDPLGRDICAYLGNDGIRLVFHPVTQLLRLIEVDNLSQIVLKYKEKIFSEPGAEVSMDKVDEFFGSTHPG